MAVRRERVILDLEGNFESKAIRDAAAIKLLKSELDGLSGKAIRSRKPLQDTERDLDNVGKAAKRNGAEIDKMSGRMRILADAVAVFGPSLVPIGAASIGAMVGFTNQLGMAASAAGVAMLAFHGVSDAVKALNTYQLEPTAHNLEAVNKKMEGLAPAAQDFARELASLMPAVRQLQQTAAAGMFPGLTDALGIISSRGPEVSNIVSELATGMGELAKEGAQALASPKWDAFFRTFETTAKPTLLDLGHALGNVTTAAADLWVAFAPFNRDFSAGLVKATADLEHWAAGLSGTKDFQSFVDYIRTSGPEVLHLLGQLGNMFIQVAEAVAPLGGPSMKILGALADALAGIADSDLGTPIFAGVAALVLFNRTLQITEKLQAATFGGPAIGRIRTMGGSFRQFGRDLDTVVMGLRSTPAEIRNLTAANSRLGASFKGFAKGAAGVGALAVASSGAADGLGLTNTATLALAGSMVGPLGAGVGGAIGGFLDMKHASDAVNDSLNMTSRTVSEAQTKLASLQTQLKDINDSNSGDVFDRIRGGIEDTFGGDFGSKVSWVPVIGSYIKAVTGARSGSDKLADGIAKTQSQLRAMKGAQAAANFETDAATAATNRYNNSLQDLQNRLANRSSYGQYLQSLIDTRNAIRENGVAFKRNGSLIDSGNAKMVAQYNQLTSLASSMQAQLATLSGPAQNKAMQRMKAQFVQLAQQMGMGRQAAVRLAEQLLNLDQINVNPKINVDTSKALAQIQKIKNELAHIPRSISTRYYVTQMNGFNKRNAGDDGRGSADGSTVPKDGGSYADRYPYMLAPGEEVISNRFGQADRHRGLLKAINAGRLADGGTAGTRHGDDSGGYSKPLFRHEGPRYYAAAYRHNRPFAKAGPSHWDWPYQTNLTPKQERQFERWVSAKNVPFDPGERITDYDMRGYWKKTKGRGWHQGSHFPDTFKTPYDTTFSHESKYATRNNPFYWHGNRLIDQRNGQVVFAANGGQVFGPGGPRDDRIPAWLSNGEFVMKAAAVDHYGAGLFEALNAQRFASGGQAGKRSSTWKPAAAHAFDLTGGMSMKALENEFWTLAHAVKTHGGHLGKGFDDLEKRAKTLNGQWGKVNKRLDDANNALSDLTSQRDSLRSTVGDSLTSNPFAASNIWSSPAASAQGIFGTLNADIANAGRFNTLAKQLQAHGVHGQALAAVEGQGVNAMAQLAGLSASDQKRYQQLFDQRARAIGSAQNTAAATYAPLIAAQAKEVAALRGDLKRIEKAVNSNEKAVERSAGVIGRAVANGTNKSASAAHRAGKH